MSDVKVTIAEINAADDAMGYGEGELTCDGPVCNRSVIGYHLAESYDHPDMDVQAFTTYWEIDTKYPNDTSPGEPTRHCEDEMSYFEDISPAILEHSDQLTKARSTAKQLLLERDEARGEVHRLRGLLLDVNRKLDRAMERM